MTEKGNDILKMIGLHNEALNARVEQAAYLNQRIKARMEGQSKPRTSVNLFKLRLSRLVTAYAFLFFVVILANLFFMEPLSKRSGSVKPLEEEFESFLAAMPGSLTQAYSEVMKWEE